MHVYVYVNLIFASFFIVKFKKWSFALVSLIGYIALGGNYAKENTKYII